jgi:hypothetical protein
MKRTAWMLTLVLLPALCLAQPAKLKMPNFSGLAEKAIQSVDISLDADMLKAAGGFMSGRADDARDVAEAIKGLEGVYVKVFTFDKPGVYSTRDIDDVIKQVETRGWKKLLSVRDKDKHVEMWMRDGSSEGGMFFVAAEPMKLVLINIAGKVDLETLRKLQGRMGVPNLPGMPGMAGSRPPMPPAPAAPAAPPAPAQGSANAP